MSTVEDSDRRRRLDEILADYLQRIDAGQKVDRANLQAEHPDLAEELSSFFEAGDQLDRAAKQEVTLAYTPSASRSKSESRGLQIRCPHCSNPVEVLVDTPYEEIS